MRFEVKAYRAGEGVVTRTLDAVDAEALAAALAAQGYRLLAARPAWRSGVGSRPARFDLLLFSRQLHALLVAGLSLVEALATLAEEHGGEPSGRVIAALGVSLREGRPLSAALAARRDLFPPLFVALVAASERTGEIPLALQRFIAYRSRMDAIRQQLVAAAIYPAVLLAVGALVGLFLITYVVPRFGRVYAELGGDIPLLSRLMLDLGSGLQHYGLPLLGAAGIAAAVLWLARERGETRWPRAVALALRWPPLAPLRRLYRDFLLAHFYRTLAVLMLGGLPVVAALGQVRGLLDPEGQAAMERVLLRVRGGGSLSEALAAAGLAPPMVLRLLRTGESAGDLPGKLEHVAALLDEEVARRTEWLARLIEPLLTLVIGLGVAFVVVLLYMPIFELAGRMR